MGIAAAITGGVASLAGSAIAGGAASHAADVQSQAATQAAQLQKQIYDTTRSDLNPFVRAGQGGLSYLSSLIPGGLQLPSAGSPTPSSTGAGSVANVPGYGPISLPPGVGQPGGPGTTNPTTPPPFSIPNQPQSTFLTDLQNMLPGSGNSIGQAGLNALTPGTSTPAGLLTATRSFVPGSGAEPNKLLSGINNFIPGASGTPDESLTALNSFTPGTDHTNPLVKQLQSLLGVGPDGASGIQAALESTPGYQFTLDQGLKSVQNGYAAKGLANSGAALKGGADYATGLSNSTYEQRLTDYLNSYNSEYTNTQNAYNSKFTNNLNAYTNEAANANSTYNSAYANALNTRNSDFTNAYNAYGQQVGIGENLAGLGENAGAQTGAIGANQGASIANTLTSGAAATAGGIVGSSNALVNGINGAAGAGVAYLNNNPSGGNSLSAPGAGSNLGGTNYSPTGIYGTYNGA